MLWQSLSYFRRTNSLLKVKWLTRRESTTSSSNKRTEILYRVYLPCIANLFTAVLNISFKEIISKNTICRKEILNLYQTLKSTSEMKLTLNFCQCLQNFSELWNLYSLVPMGNRFWWYFRQLFIILAFTKCKKHYNILKVIIILVQGL